jgi:riboflavin biosynthesis pyrimidine reductase
MALLRAAADVIVVGARTLSDSPGHQWTPATLVPDCVDELQEYRRALGGAGSLAPLVVVSASGLLPAHVALTSPAIPTTVLTTNAAAPIARDFPLVNRVVVEGGGRIDGATLTQVLAREFDARLVLTEGGPTLMGALVAGGHVSELFLTVAPRVAGRDADAARPGLVEGFAADPRALQEYALLSVRRREATLLLRYRRR